MDNARVALFEDDPTVSDALARRLQRHGHTVVVHAADMDEAKHVIENLNDGEVDVAIVDGNLGSGSGDGAIITSLLKDKQADLPVVGNSANGKVAGADFNAEKAGSAILLSIIEDIPRPLSA